MVSERWVGSVLGCVLAVVRHGMQKTAVVDDRVKLDEGGFGLIYSKERTMVMQWRRPWLPVKCRELGWEGATRWLIVWRGWGK
jgi:hypothetical protein